MKAIVYHNFGSPDGLELVEIEKPVIEDDQMLLKVYAVAVNPHDWYCLTGTPFLARLMAGGLLKPKHKVLGNDVAGRVEAVGANVKQFKPGDEVFGMLKHGGFAEYASISQHTVALKPPGMSFEQAAAIPLAALTALQCLRNHGRLESGQKVLINGASGGVGTFAVQIARSFGAEVTGVCSTGNLELVYSLGADQVIDYTREDFTQAGQLYDLIFDAVRKRSFSDCKRALGPQGIYVTTEISLALLLQAQWAKLTGSQRMVPMLTQQTQNDLLVLTELFQAGKVKSVISKCYDSLSAVPDALRHISTGHAQGKIIITL